MGDSITLSSITVSSTPKHTSLTAILTEFQKTYGTSLTSDEKKTLAAVLKVMGGNKQYGAFYQALSARGGHKALFEAVQARLVAQNCRKKSPERTSLTAILTEFQKPYGTSLTSDEKKTLAAVLKVMGGNKQYGAFYQALSARGGHNAQFEAVQARLVAQNCQNIPFTITRATMEVALEQDKESMVTLTGNNISSLSSSNVKVVKNIRSEPPSSTLVVSLTEGKIKIMPTSLEKENLFLKISSADDSYSVFIPLSPPPQESTPTITSVTGHYFVSPSFPVNQLTIIGANLTAVAGIKKLNNNNNNVVGDTIKNNTAPADCSTMINAAAGKRSCTKENQFILISSFLAPNTAGNYSYALVDTTGDRIGNSSFILTVADPTPSATASTWQKQFTPRAALTFGGHTEGSPAALPRQTANVADQATTFGGSGAVTLPIVGKYGLYKDSYEMGVILDISAVGKNNLRNASFTGNAAYYINNITATSFPFVGSAHAGLGYRYASQASPTRYFPTAHALLLDVAGSAGGRFSPQAALSAFIGYRGEFLFGAEGIRKNPVDSQSHSVKTGANLNLDFSLWKLAAALYFAHAEQQIPSRIGGATYPNHAVEARDGFGFSISGESRRREISGNFDLSWLATPNTEFNRDYLLTRLNLGTDIDAYTEGWGGELSLAYSGGTIDPYLNLRGHAVRLQWRLPAKTEWASALSFYYEAGIFNMDYPNLSKFARHGGGVDFDLIRFAQSFL